MPFKYDPYESTYVDPNSVEIAKALRERFIQNFNAADAVGQELNKLNAADFENDQKLKAELDTSVRDNLSQYAETGNYENMTFKVAGTARDYRDRSAPITENYTRYAAYQQDLAKDYKDGKISSAAYRNSIPMTKAMGYSGISMDPNTGMVDPKSYFSGMSIATDPKITEKLIQALNLIEADSNEKTISKIYMGENGEMKYTSMQGWEGKTAEKVQKAYDAVMGNSEVQNYIAQEAKFKAYEAYSNPDGSLNKDALNQVSASGIQMHKQEMSKLQKLIGDPKTPQYKKDQYTATLNAYNQSLNYLSTTKDPAQQLNYASSLFKEELLAPYQAMASLKISNKTKSSYSEDYSDMEMRRQDAARARSVELEKLQMQAQSQIKITSEGKIDETFDPAVNETEIKTAQQNVIDDTAILNDPNRGNQEKIEAQQRINTNTEFIVARKMHSSNENAQVIPEAVVSLYDSNGVYGDTFAFGFGTEGITMKQLWSDYQTFRGAGGASGDLSVYYNSDDFYKLITSDPGSNPETDAFIKQVNNRHSGEDGALVLQELKESLTKNVNAKIIGKVAKNRTFTTQTVPPGTSPIMAVKAAEEIRSQFNTLGDLQSVQGTIYTPAAGDQQVTGNVEQMIKTWEKDTDNNGTFKAGSKIMGVRFGVANGYQFQDKSQNGQYAIFTVAPEAEGEAATGKAFKEIYVPLENIASADMQAELNKPVNRLAKLVNSTSYFGEYKKPTQTYEYEKKFSDAEVSAVQFSNELQNKNANDAAKFLKENAEVFAQYQANGYLANDGSFIGVPARKIIIKVDSPKNEKDIGEAEIFLESVDGVVEPMMEYNSQGQYVRAGKMSMNGERFTSIVNDVNLGLYNPSGYNLVNGY